MTASKHHRRVRWKTRRAPQGWLPIVLVGEEPIVLAAVATKSAAREAARQRAALVKGEV